MPWPFIATNFLEELFLTTNFFRKITILQLRLLSTAALTIYQLVIKWAQVTYTQIVEVHLCVSIIAESHITDQLRTLKLWEFLPVYLLLHSCVSYSELLLFDPVQDGLFRGCSGMGGGTVIPCLMKIQKIYESRDTSLEFIRHQHLFTGLAISRNSDINRILIHNF